MCETTCKKIIGYKIVRQILCLNLPQIHNNYVRFDKKQKCFFFCEEFKKFKFCLFYLTNHSQNLNLTSLKFH